jgi:hypothetical protein
VLMSFTERSAVLELLVFGIFVFPSAVSPTSDDSITLPSKYKQFKYS